MENQMESSETIAITKEAQYDARAEQRIEFKVKRGNKIHKVAHILKPPSDADLIEYEKRRNVRLSEADKTELGESGLSTNDDSFNAAIALWDKLVVSVEGYTPSGYWREKVKEGDKVSRITENILAVEALDEAIAETTDELLDEDAENASRTVELRSMFNGEQVLTSHTLRTPSANELKDYRALMAESYTVRGSKMRSSDIKIPSKAKRLMQFFDNLVIESNGYAGGIVPLHHKMITVTTHLTREQETLGGN